MVLNLRSASLRFSGSLLLSLGAALLGGTLSGCGSTTASNPVPVSSAPTVSAISPNTAVAGSAAIVITVSGSNFTASSTVLWNNTARATTFSSATQLTVQITAADLLVAGTDTVSVQNTAGTSSGVAFTVAAAPNPLPVLTSLSPATAVAGSSGLALTLTGSSFIGGSQVLVNGALRTTTFVSASSLSAQLSAADLAAAGPLAISVSNPAPGGGASSTLTFAVTNPVPVLSTLSPVSATVGSGSTTVMLGGSGFVSNSTVLVNGTAHTTTFMSANALSVVLSAVDLSGTGTLALTVSNPTPGGGASAALSFAVNNPAPVLSSLNPVSATTGSGSITLTANGSGFVSASTILINGVARTTTFVSGTAVSVLLSSADLAAAGTLAVSLSNPVPGGGVSATLTFAVNNAAPSLSSLSPASVPAGSSVFTLTVSGSGFVSNSSIQVNGAARTTAFVSASTLSTQLTAADVAAAGTLAISVSTPNPGGGTSGVLSFTINNPAPTVSSLSPASAFVGSAPATIAVNGSAFLTTSTVLVNGAARSTVYISATVLNVQLTAADLAATGTLAISVSNPAPGGGVSSALPFSVNNPAPVLASLSPANAIAGSAPTTVTLTGSAFLAGSSVTVNATTRATTFVSITALTVQLTAADLSSAGTLSISVSNPTPGGGTSSSFSFTVNNPGPALNSLNPVSAIVGSGATSVTLTGSAFVTTSSVSVNGTARATTYISSTALSVQLTAADLAATGTLPILVTNPAPGGGTSNAQMFAILNPVCSLTAISPTSAVAGGGPLAVTLSGANFVASTQGLFNGASRSTNYNSSTALTVQLTSADLATPGTANVTASTPAPGGGVCGPVSFTIAAPVPVISSLSPSTAGAGSGSLTVMVTGTGFIAGTSGSVISVNGAARMTTFVSATSLTVALTTADLATAGAISVTVSTPAPGGGTSNALAFTITNPTPTITTLSPSTAIAGASAFSMTVTGTNFVSGSAVLWNGSARSTSFTSSTQMTAQITAADITTAGPDTVTVSNPTPGGGISNALTFTVQNPLPNLSAISPSSALVNSQAVTITLSGTTFSASSQVLINGSAASTTYVSSTSLTAVIPASSLTTAGTLAISVTNPGVGTSSSVSFSVNNPLPVLSSISPTTVTLHAEPLRLIVSGSSFVSSSQVFFNGVARATTVVSSQQATIELSASDFNTAAAYTVSVSTSGPGGGNSSSQNFTVAASVAGPFAGCTDVDINIGTKPAGNATINGNSVTVSGSGADINGTADSFNYCYVPVTGNFQMIARINQPTSPAAINAGAKNGVMVRESNSSNSRHETVYINAGTLAISSNRREQTGNTAIDRSKVVNPSPTYPYFVRLQRFGDLISLDYSPDGTVFQSLDSIESIVGLATNVEIGFAVTSRTTSLMTTTFDNISLTPISTPTQPSTSWIGNTYGGGGSWIIYRGQALTTDTNGDVLIQGQGEEESAEFLDTNGNFLAYPTNSHFNTEPGIAWDPTNSYVWESGAPFVDSGGVAKGGVNYQRLDGVNLGAVLQTGSGSNQTAGRTIYGIAIYNNILYAIDTANQATPSDTSKVTVHTINLASTPFKEGTPFYFPAGATYMTVDSGGTLWVVFTGTNSHVEAYDRSGNDLGTHMSGFIDPRGITTDAQNNVYVADYGAASQQVLVYTNTGTPITALGALGGNLSTCNGTNPGQADPCKLDHPEGITVDANGSLIVSSSGAPSSTYGGLGMVLRKYSNVAGNLSAGLSSANLVWHREGLEYIEGGAPDPASETDIYTKHHHYKMDYSQPAGQGWTLYGSTLDETHYPNDIRLTQRYDAGAWLRTINGNKFIVTTDEYGSTLAFYRIQQGSEIVVPYATFVRETDRGKSDDAGTLWIDTNLNGQSDTGELQSVSPPAAASPSAEYLAWYVDANGDVWTGQGYNTTARTLRYKMSIAPNGYPTWTLASPLSYSVPEYIANVSGSQTLILREVYNPTTDTMFLGGYPASSPKPTGYPVGALGTAVIRYDHFTNGATAGCTINLPFLNDLSGQAGTGDAAKAMDVAGTLIGIGYDFSDKIVVNSTVGSCPNITTFTPGPEVGGVEGTIDSQNTVMMYYRGPATNEYDFFVEEGGQHKIIMYRYIYTN